MKNNLTFYFIIVFFALGCATKKTIETMSVVQIETLKMGATKNDVISLLGSSYEKSPPVNERDHEGWLYYNADQRQWQRAAVIFDGTKQLVVAKVFIPLDGEPEYNLDFLLQKKFANLKFEKWL